MDTKRLHLLWPSLVLSFWLLTITAEAQQQPVPQDSIREKENTLQRKYEQNIRNSAQLEIDGLIVDETITKMGRDFYDVFHRQWEAPPMASNFTIQIKEFPARGMGALIQVTVNDQTILEQQLQPRYDIIEEIATYAAGHAYEFLVQDQLQRQLEAEGKKAREIF